MISIILVSHSAKITEGIVEMIDEMVGESDNVRIFSAGGTDDGRLGTNTMAILAFIEQAKHDKHILIFADIGSAILSSETAIDLIEDDDLRQKVLLVDAPLVEGAFTAAVQATVSDNLDEILVELQLI